MSFVVETRLSEENWKTENSDSTVCVHAQVSIDSILVLVKLIYTSFN